MACVVLNAQYDSVPSPFSIYFGAGIGAGKGGTALKGEHHGYEALQYDGTFYVDYTSRIGFLINERFGLALDFGQLGNTRNGKRFGEYAANAFPGYSFQFEYSDLHFGYRYRYITPQLVYRMGREPFNLTINAGVGTGRLHSAEGTAIYKRDSSNYFIEQRYWSDDVWNLNIAVSAEVAYMRQLSQHWFMNAGVYLGYNSIRQDYSYSTVVNTYPSNTGTIITEAVQGLQHHGSAGIFVYFQWNTKESEKAYYE